MAPKKSMIDSRLNCIYNKPWITNGTKANELPTFAKHGVDFIAAERFEWATAIEARDNRFDYGEERWVALGFIGKRLHVLTYTRRIGTIRLISLRRANNREREHYAKTQA